ncbi:MAG: hydrolase [Candidatus Xenobia bacterium]
MKCVFCDIVAGRLAAREVYRDSGLVAFLDHRPLFPGHVLVVPSEHHETLSDLPPEKLPDLFGLVRRLSQVVPTALSAQGSFVALNNKVSQSVPHLHVHVVPRSKGDGMKGFFWPRQPYRDEAHMVEVAERIAAALKD